MSPFSSLRISFGSYKGSTSCMISSLALAFATAKKSCGHCLCDFDGTESATR
jgi:hypothetical protein